MPSIFENNRPKPVRDTLTGEVYRSRYQAGKALASRFGLDPNNKLV